MTNYEIMLKKAKEVSQNAYAPYSRFKVGACILTDTGNIYTGCNFENASYGLSICAERNAIGSAVAAGEKKIRAIAVYSPAQDNCYPCGACRQVIYEFAFQTGVDVITENNGKLVLTTITELLPKGFSL